MFSKACQYALRSVLLLATEYDQDTKVGVKEISERLNIPKHFLGKVLQALAKGNVISSVKGPGGGFYLSESDRSNSLFSIVECIEGHDTLYQCILGREICADEKPCPFHFQVIALREGFYYQLKKSTIEQFATRRPKQFNLE